MAPTLAFAVGVLLGFAANWVIARLALVSETVAEDPYPALPHEGEEVEIDPALSQDGGAGAGTGSAVLPDVATARTRQLIAQVAVLLASGLLVLFAYLDYGWGWAGVLYALYALVLLVTLVLDWRFHDIYLVVLVAGAVLALLGALLIPGVGFGGPLGGALIGGGLIYLLHLLGQAAYGGDALAFGDVQLAVMLGLMLGYPNVISTLLLGVLLAGLSTLLLLLLRRKQMNDFVPIGASFCLAAIIALLFREQVWDFLRFDSFNRFLSQLGSGLGDWLNHLLGAR